MLWPVFFGENLYSNKYTGHSLNEKGEGVLNVWKNFNSYIEAENNLGRKTIGYVYYLKEDEINSIVEYFNSILKKTT